MKIKNVNLEYWVFYYTDKPNRFNILKNLAEPIAKLIRTKKIKCREDLYIFLKHEFQYHYWSKTEYEYAVNNLFDMICSNTSLEHIREKATKLDVYYQIEPNLNMITDYIINKMKIEF